MRNSDLPTRAEVLEHGKQMVAGTDFDLAILVSQDVPMNGRLACVYLLERGPGWLLSCVHFKHRSLDGKRLTATDWQGMVREAIGILEGEK